MVHMKINSGPELQTDFHFAKSRFKQELAGWQGDRLEYSSYQLPDAEGGLYVVTAELYSGQSDDEESDKRFAASGLTESECRELEKEAARFKSMLEYRCEDDPDSLY